MLQIREKEFTPNPVKYFNKNMFPAVNKSEYDEILEPDDDLRSAITAKELLKMLHEDIHQMFNEKK